MWRTRVRRRRQPSPSVPARRHSLALLPARGSHNSRRLLLPAVDRSVGAASPPTRPGRRTHRQQQQQQLRFLHEPNFPIGRPRASLPALPRQLLALLACFAAAHDSPKFLLCWGSRALSAFGQPGSGRKGSRTGGGRLRSVGSLGHAGNVTLPARDFLALSFLCSEAAK